MRGHCMVTGDVAGDEHWRTTDGSRFEQLVDQLQRGRIDRRTFMVRAIALGVTGSAVCRPCLGSARPRRRTRSAATIGNPAIPHIEDNRQGHHQALLLVAADRIHERNRRRRRRGSQAGASPTMATRPAASPSSTWRLTTASPPTTAGGIRASSRRTPTRSSPTRTAMVYMATYNSGAAKISIPIMNEAGMAMISYANTYPGLTKDDRGQPKKASRTCTTRAASATTCASSPRTISRARLARTGRSSRRASARPTSLTTRASTVTASPRSSTTHFWSWAAKSSAAEGYDPKAPDYQALMTKIADTGPDSSTSAPRSKTIPPKVLLDMRSLMPVDEVIFLGPDGLINQALHRRRG